LAGEAEQPRLLLTSVPYAVKAADAETLGGFPASAFLRANSTASASSKAPNDTPNVSETGQVPSGTGTTNSLTKWVNGTGLLGDSSLFEVNSFLGVGTSNPTSGLHIVNGTNANFTLQSTYSAGPQMEFKNAGTAAADWVFGIPGNVNGSSFFIYDAKNLNSVFTIEQGAPANTFYANASGFMGLGTSNPSSALHIVNNTNANFTLQSTYSAGPQMRFKNAGTGAADWIFGIPGSPNGNSFFIYDVTNSNSVFTIEQGAPANSFYAKANGFLGVGTGSPTAKLDVSGTIKGTAFSGDGSALTNVTSAAIADGTIVNADINAAAAIAAERL